jgi:transcription factor C subunit 7
MLHRIYVIRHGETADIAQDEKGTGIDPTGNFADIVLSETGREQAKQTAKRLALENLPIDVVYSAPSYQCLETLRPFVTDAKGATVHQVRVENGLG